MHLTTAAVDRLWGRDATIIAVDGITKLAQGRVVLAATELIR
jgi:hypothetical protein